MQQESVINQLIYSVEVKFREQLIEISQLENEKIRRYLASKDQLQEEYEQQMELLLGPSGKQILANILNSTLMLFEARQFDSVRALTTGQLALYETTPGKRERYLRAGPGDTLMYKLKPSETIESPDKVWSGTILTVLRHGYNSFRFLVRSLEVPQQTDMVFPKQIQQVIYRSPFEETTMMMPAIQPQVKLPSK